MNGLNNRISVVNSIETRHRSLKKGVNLQPHWSSWSGAATSFNESEDI